MKYAKFCNNKKTIYNALDVTKLYNKVPDETCFKQKPLLFSLDRSLDSASALGAVGLWLEFQREMKNLQSFSLINLVFYSGYFQFNPYSSTHIMIWNSKQNIV